MQLFEQFLQHIIAAVSYFSSVETVATFMIWHKVQRTEMRFVLKWINYYTTSIVINIAFGGLKY